MGSVAIPGFGGLGWVWEAVSSDSWVWRRFWEVGLGEGLGRSGRLVLEAVCSDSWVWRRSGRWVWEEVWEAVCSDSWVWRRWSGRWVWGDRMLRFLGLETSALSLVAERLRHALSR